MKFKIPNNNAIDYLDYSLEMTMTNRVALTVLKILTFYLIYVTHVWISL